MLAAAAGRPIDRIDPPARDALRLGVYQLLHTRVPPHAAVATTVDLVRLVAPAAAGFANAVLRRVAERDLAGWLDAVAPPTAEDPVGHLAVVHAHPEWIVRAFAERLGGDLAETAEALAANNERPIVHLCARPGRTSAAELAGGDRGPGRCVPPVRGLPARGCARRVRGDPRMAGPTCRTRAPSSWRRPSRRRRSPDPTSGGWTCAPAPAARPALLGALAAQRGAHVTAVEVTPHRAKLVEQAVRGLPVQVLCADGRSVGSDPDLPAGGFDRVLVDAPCTGLGSLRRRPESRWRRHPADLPPLTKLQRELLAAALAAVRPGGVVAYVTCSPHIVETQVTVKETLRRGRSDVELVDARPYLPPELRDLGDGPTVQLWPHRHGTDAMFLALLRPGP